MAKSKLSGFSSNENSDGSITYDGEGNSRSGGSLHGLSQYAVAALNQGTAKGTSEEAAIDRFRSAMGTQETEWSAWLDSSGYLHALGTSGEAGSTAVVPRATLKDRKFITTLVHNHPDRNDGGARKQGGTLSKADYRAMVNTYLTSGGRTNSIVATASEGIYRATMTKPVTQRQVSNAIGRAEKAVKGKTFRSESAMWKAVTNARAKELGKLGIKVTFEQKKMTYNRLITSPFSEKVR